MKKYLILSLLICIAFTIEAHSQTSIRRVDNVAITDVSSKVLDANKERNYLAIENNGGGKVFVKFDEAHTAEEGFTVRNGETYFFNLAPINAVYLKSSAGQNEDVVIVEGVK